MLRSKLGESWKNRSRSCPYSHSIPFPDVLPEFKKRVNVRLDLGFGKHQTGFIFNINEAF